jgi:beta-lactamase class D
MRDAVIAFCFLLIFQSALSAEPAMRTDYFGEYSGTFVLLDIKTDKTIVINENLSQKRYSPESTFKIASTLIALESGYWKNEDSTIQWDGVAYPVPKWNSNQTLRTAVENSVVWCYQKFMREKGVDFIKAKVCDLSYGNMDVSGGIDHFWLDSTLEISPHEQVQFIRKIFFDEKDKRKNSVAIMKKLLLRETKDNCSLFGKTGSSGGGYLSKVDRVNRSGQLAWFVGFVETNTTSYAFALLIKGDKGASGKKAEEITKTILADYKIY